MLFHTLSLCSAPPPKSALSEMLEKDGEGRERDREREREIERERAWVFPTMGAVEGFWAAR